MPIFMEVRCSWQTARAQLSKDPVKRGLNSYRYCDNDPADYVDPTGEIAHILWGIGLGGAFGFGGGFLSSAVSQKASGGEIDWKEALGSGINGLITGATQGGLLASGAGIPAALFANTLAGTAGSAAEQYIGSGKIDAGKSITSGLNNAVSNAIYGTRPLGSMKEAFGRGVGAGAATSALNYISDTLGEKTLHSRMGMGLLSGMTGAAFSPYNFLRNPRRGCGSASPFVPSLGYGSARGYQYDLPKIENGSQSQSKRFSFGDFLREVAIGGITGGLSSAAFYGAGKGIERLIDGLRPSRGGEDSVRKYYQVTSKENAKAILNSDHPALKGTEFKEVYVWIEQPTLKQAKNSGARYLDTVIEFETNVTFSKDTSIVDRSLWNIARVSDRPGPISISNVVETGFKESKRWWQFWKK